MINDVMQTNFAAKIQSKNYVHVIEELLHLLPDPASKLKFIKEAINEHYTISAPYKYFALLAKNVWLNRHSSGSIQDVVFPIYSTNGR